VAGRDAVRGAGRGLDDGGGDPAPVLPHGGRRAAGAAGRRLRPEPAGTPDGGPERLHDEIESLEIESRGDLDLRGFLGLDPEVPAGYPEIRYQVRIRSNGTEEQMREIHEMVMATSPNFYNLARPVKLVPELVLL
jgi:hypothetical protein